MFEVFQAGPASEQVQCDVEDVVSFVVGSVELEDFDAFFDALPEFELSDHFEDQGDAGRGNGLLFFSELEFCFGATDA